MNLAKLIKELWNNSNFTEEYIQANKEYRERYSRYMECLLDARKGEKSGRVAYFNKRLFAEEIFNVNSNQPFLSLSDYLEGRYH